MARQPTAIPHRYAEVPFEFEATESEADRMALLVALSELGPELQALAEQVPTEALQTPFRPDGWTARQLIHHMADAAVMMLARVMVGISPPPTFLVAMAAEQGKEALAEFPFWDEETLTARPGAQIGPIEPSLVMHQLAADRIVDIMSGQPESVWNARYARPRARPVTVEMTMAMLVWHSRRHMGHLLRAVDAYAAMQAESNPPN